MTNSIPTLRTNSDGSKEWLLNGKRHRTDGPAVEYANGTKNWYLNGEYHRIDGPAVELSHGTKYWYVKGKLHRADGPAVEYADGTKEWWVNWKQHRTDGPAFEGAEGTKAWYVNGEEISVPYSYVLTAAFACGLPIPKEVLRDIFKAISQADNSQAEQLNQLHIILNKHWPMHVHKILAALFMDMDPVIKHLAFSLLGCKAMRDNTQSGVHL